jgi:glucose-1-phosphate cytidylyltransferase
MKVVILAGGYGTRLSEETDARPKPMVEVGGRPILWHLMRYYAHFGFDDFVIALGYKGFMVKEYFANYRLHNSDITVDLARGDITYHGGSAENWRVTLVDTGQETMTGGRVRRIRDYVDGTFMLTYGDGLATVDLAALAAFHRQKGRSVTVTSVQPPGRFGVLEVSDDGGVRAFHEKPSEAGGWINAGFFVMEPRVFDYLEGDATILEREPMEKLAADGELVTFRHGGFWKPMDTLRDKRALESLWDGGSAPWKVWA